MANVIKDFSYNYERIIQVLWKKGNKKKKIFTLKVFEMMPHGTLKFQIVFWALRPTSTKKMCLLGMSLLTCIQSLEVCKMHVKHLTTFPMCDVVSWSTMILCPAQAWAGGFSAVWTNATWGSEATFMGVLSACTNVGLVEDGWWYVQSMSKDHAMIPTVRH
jgi:hypothetical protein